MLGIVKASLVFLAGWVMYDVPDICARHGRAPRAPTGLAPRTAASLFPPRPALATPPVLDASRLVRAAARATQLGKLRGRLRP